MCTTHLLFTGLSFFGIREHRDLLAVKNRFPIRSAHQMPTRVLDIQFQSVLIAARIIHFTRNSRRHHDSSWMFCLVRVFREVNDRPMSTDVEIVHEALTRGLALIYEPPPDPGGSKVPHWDPVTTGIPAGLYFKAKPGVVILYRLLYSWNI